METYDVDVETLDVLVLNELATLLVRELTVSLGTSSVTAHDKQWEVMGVQWDLNQEAEMLLDVIETVVTAYNTQY